MKKLLSIVLLLLFVIISAETTFNIDMNKGTYQGLVYNCKFENSVIFDVSSDTSEYSVRVDLYSLSGDYLFNIFNGTRPADYKIRWNALTPDYKHLKPGVYLIYFEKKDSNGTITLKFFLPLLAAINLN